MLVINSTIFFLNSIPKTSLLGKFDFKAWKFFILNGIRYNELIKGADSEFDNISLKVSPQNTF